MKIAPRIFLAEKQTVQEAIGLSEADKLKETNKANREGNRYGQCY